MQFNLGKGCLHLENYGSILYDPFSNKMHVKYINYNETLLLIYLNLEAFKL